MVRPSGSLGKFKVELGRPFSGLCSMEPVQGDNVQCRWLPREYVIAGTRIV